jgi:hypothetical protein
LRPIADSGIVSGLGTDATIVSHYSPFVTLAWVVSGLDVGGNKVLDQVLTREEALIAHRKGGLREHATITALVPEGAGRQIALSVLPVPDRRSRPPGTRARWTGRMTFVAAAPGTGIG